jgi:Domain of unknown function (DUF4149)
MNLARVAMLLAGLWAGLLLAIAAIAAPAAFAVLPAAEAGRVVGRLFAHEATTSLFAAVVLFMIERRRAGDAAEAGGGSVMSANLLLVAGALFCTVAGHYGLQPMMATARTGQGAWSFGALHAASTAFYGLKTLLVLALAWRLAGAAAAGPIRPGPTS